MSDPRACMTIMELRAEVERLTAQLATADDISTLLTERISDEAAIKECWKANAEALANVANELEAIADLARGCARCGPYINSKEV